MTMERMVFASMVSVLRRRKVCAAEKRCFVWVVAGSAWRVLSRYKHLSFDQGQRQVGWSVVSFFKHGPWAAEDEPLGEGAMAPPGVWPLRRECAAERRDRRHGVMEGGRGARLISPNGTKETRGEIPPYHQQ
jgi:hypothetical protein